MYIFLLIYILSFAIAFKEVISGNRQGFFLYVIFGLSIYTTAMSVAFTMGLRAFIPFLQVFKELLIVTMLTLNLGMLRTRPRFHIIDYLVLVFLAYTAMYAILPIGDQGFTVKVLALKSTSFFTLIYFTGRLIDIKNIYVNKYFNYIILLTIAAGLVVLFEFFTDEFLQTRSGYADYVYYVYNIEPDGIFGLSSTFQSEGGYKRFASFFTNPLEHAAATIIALAVIMALYTRDDNKIQFKPVGILAFSASVLSIVLAFSRAPFVSYLLMIYIYAHLTGLKIINRIINYSFLAGACYLLYLVTRFENKVDGIVAVIVSTIDFSNPSSVGHVVEWVQGVLAIAAHPLGLGLGSSGRIGSSMGDQSVGGENQYIIIGVQAGLVALILYLVIYILFIKQGLKYLKILKGKERKICLAVLMIKIGFLIPSLTSEFEGSSYISYMNWFLSGLFISVIMQHQPAAKMQIA